jgi:D-arabinose 1-dehydrogenase-like Zn-dependent alcohol dehydrogenase
LLIFDQTGGLALLDGQKLELPSVGSKALQKDSWIIVMGGSGSVGRYCVQLASLAGYKVLASCSPSKNEVRYARLCNLLPGSDAPQLALQAGASATFNNRAPMEEQLAEIKKITSGNFSRVVDTSIAALELSVKALETISKASDKYFATVDDW